MRCWASARGPGPRWTRRWPGCCPTPTATTRTRPGSSRDQAQAWLRALNDVRLTLGVRLGVTEEFEDEWGQLDPLDPRATAFEVYAWLGDVQESLVQALS
jgi:hypothetical protein